MTDARAVLDLQISERDFQAQVLALARLCQWRCYHTFDSRRSERGFPDLVLVRRSRVLFIELKSERGRPTSAQQAWLADLEGTGKVDVRLWRPSDWNEIEATLS